MNINLGSLSNYALSFFRESVQSTLTAQQKKILVIASLAFAGLAACLTACYVRGRYCFKTKLLNEKNDVLNNQDDKIYPENTKDKFKTGETSSELSQEIFDEEAPYPLGSTLENLPQEVLLHIFNSLDFDEWGAISTTNKFLHHLSQDRELIASLLTNWETKGFHLPLDKKLELAKHAGPFLTQLNLEKSKVTDQDLEELFIACPKIQSLNLSDCRNLTNATIDKLPKGLQSLDLSSCKKLTDAAALKKLPTGLLSLNLIDCWKLTDAAIDKFPAGLQSLDLSRCKQLTDASIDNLPKDLQTLYLDYCGKLTDAAMDNLPIGLQSLNLYGCTPLTDAIIDKLPAGLQTLGLSGCEKLTDAAIDKLPKGLQWLGLSHCKKLTDAAIDNLPKGLLLLILSGCENLTNAAMHKLPQGLQSLHLSRCKQLTDVSIDSLPKGLQSLNLSYCKKLTDAALKKLPTGLQVLYIHGSLRFTKDAILQWQKNTRVVCFSNFT